MSNRLYALLILILFFGGIAGVYYYLFVMRVSSILVDVGSLTGVTVDLQNELQGKYDLTCDHTCALANVPPVKYTLTVSKFGYDTEHQQFTLDAGVRKRITVRMKETVYLTPIVDDPASPPLYTYHLKPFRIVRTLYRTASGVQVSNAVVNPYDQLASYRIGGIWHVYDLRSLVDHTLDGFTGSILMPKRVAKNASWLLATGSGALLYDPYSHASTMHPLYSDYVPLS